MDIVWRCSVWNLQAHNTLAGGWFPLCVHWEVQTQSEWLSLLLQNKYIYMFNIYMYLFCSNNIQATNILKSYWRDIARLTDINYSPVLSCPKLSIILFITRPLHFYNTSVETLIKRCTFQRCIFLLSTVFTHKDIHFIVTAVLSQNSTNVTGTNYTDRRSFFLQHNSFYKSESYSVHWFGNSIHIQFSLYQLCIASICLNTDHPGKACLCVWCLARYLSVFLVSGKVPVW